MNSGRTVFAQLIQHLPHKEFRSSFHFEAQQLGFQLKDDQSPCRLKFISKIGVSGDLSSFPTPLPFSLP
ncbi:MAG: hypothetical protein ABR902_03090 [Candidatus Korobacteraceae bacterium]|jgi:hypothetical protein